MFIGQRKQTALDLTIKGSLGTFFVDGKAPKSTRVEYLQTHVTLSTQGDQEERLLQQLRPVREVFNIRDLDFEQIMQRDIDDARVSSDLIPYLLGQQARDIVKFFPPIVVVVLPKGEGEKPADYYPTVVTKTLPAVDEEPERLVTSAGPIGSEVFELRRWIVDGRRLDHNDAELRLNTTNSRLVIVDGQHRAMALIALYRNLAVWPEGTGAIKPYYERWAPSVVRAFDLSNLQLPVLFCTFPELDGGHAALKVHEACRSVFLALNKHARKVTRARNYLLDDNDIISAFMRKVLTDIKTFDARSDATVRLWNVELDAHQDKNRLYSPVAITGVTHLYHLIETAMLGDPPQHKLQISNVKLGKRTDLDLHALSRLRAKNKLRKQHWNSKREACDAEATAILVECFTDWYGQYIVRILSEFAPYDRSNRVSYELHEELSASSADAAAAIKAMLFDGQGMDRVFESYTASLRDEAKKAKNDGQIVDPHLNAVEKGFSARAKELETRIATFKSRRVDSLTSQIPAAVRKSESVRKSVGTLFDDTLTTSAFQQALAIAFFDVIERRNKQLSEVDGLPSETVGQLFDEYIGALNSFFFAANEADFRKLIAVMFGKLVQTEAEFEVVRSDAALRNILVGGELKPNEWPKFRAMLVEIWRSHDPAIESLLHETRSGLRRAVLSSYVARRVKAHAYDLTIPESKVTTEERDRIRMECAESYAAGLRHLGARVSAQDLVAEAEPPAENPDAELGDDTDDIDD